MKKLNILLILLLSVFLTGCAPEKKQADLFDTIVDRGKIIVGIKADSKPFGFIENGEITGFDADVAYYIANKIFSSNDKAHVEFVPLEPSQRISALNGKKTDIIIATFSINSKRKEVVDFSIPYYIAGQAVMVKNGSKITSLERLNNKRIAVVLGTTGEKTARYLAPNATTIGSVSYKDAFNYLKTGQVDAILADDSLLYGLIINNSGYKILPARYTEEFYAAGLRKGEENLKLKSVINSIITSMQTNGELNRIKEKWIPKV